MKPLPETIIRGLLVRANSAGHSARLATARGDELQESNANPSLILSAYREAQEYEHLSLAILRYIKSNITDNLKEL